VRRRGGPQAGAHSHAESCRLDADKTTVPRGQQALGSKLSVGAGKRERKMAQYFRAITTTVPLPESVVLSTVNCIPRSLSKSFLWQKYALEMNSVSQIAREISSAKETVRRYLTLWDIPLRPTDSKQRLNKGQVGFGEKRVKALIQQNKQELAVIEKMKALRGQGFSYWKIAEILNSMKVPTKSRKAKWQAATVMKILKKNGVF